MMVIQMKESNEDEQIQRMFGVFDKNDDKFIDVAELKFVEIGVFLFCGSIAKTPSQHNTLDKGVC